MNTKYISKIFSGAIFSGMFFLALSGITPIQAYAVTPTPVFVDGNPTCADINADNTNFPGVASDNGFSTGNAPNQNPKTYVIPNTGTVTVNYNADNNITFTSSAAFITAVIVKAGSGAYVYAYNPPTASGGPLRTPANKNPDPNDPNEKGAGLSHLVFCYDTTSLGTTAATAMIEGRVQVEGVKFRGSVLVTILNTRTLETQTVMTSRLGYYQFEDLSVGDTYVLNVRGKGFAFTPQTISLTEDSALDILGSVASRSRK